MQTLLIRPIDIATRQSRRGCSRMLVELGADVNAVDANGSSLPYVAAQNNNVEIVRVLVAMATNVNAVDANGYSLSAAFRRPSQRAPNNVGVLVPCRNVKRAETPRIHGVYIRAHRNEHANNVGVVLSTLPRSSILLKLFAFSSRCDGRESLAYSSNWVLAQISEEERWLRTEALVSQSQH